MKSFVRRTTCLRPALVGPGVLSLLSAPPLAPRPSVRPEHPGSGAASPCTETGNGTSPHRQQPVRSRVFQGNCGSCPRQHRAPARAASVPSPVVGKAPTPRPHPRLRTATCWQQTFEVLLHVSEKDQSAADADRNSLGAASCAELAEN